MIYKHHIKKLIKWCQVEPTIVNKKSKTISFHSCCEVPTTKYRNQERKRINFWTLQLSTYSLMFSSMFTLFCYLTYYLISCQVNRVSVYTIVCPYCSVLTVCACWCLLLMCFFCFFFPLYRILFWFFFFAAYCCWADKILFMTKCQKIKI